MGFSPLQTAAPSEDVSVTRTRFIARHLSCSAVTRRPTERLFAQLPPGPAPGTAAEASVEATWGWAHVVEHMGKAVCRGEELLEERSCCRY